MNRIRMPVSASFTVRVLFVHHGLFLDVMAVTFGRIAPRSIRGGPAVSVIRPRDPLLFLWNTASGWAHLSAEDYEQAMAAARQAIDCNPEFPDSHMVRAAAAALAGAVGEARLALGELLRGMPGLTPADERLLRPFRKAADQERLLAGLRAAGLPA
jgi:hypothetical protein